MTSLKLLSVKQTTFCHASVTCNCVTLFKNKRDAEEHDYNILDASLFVVHAHNPWDVRLDKKNFGNCEFCDEPIVAWCVVRYNHVHFPDEADFNYAKAISEDLPVAQGSTRGWHKKNSGGCYAKDKDLSDQTQKNGLLVYDIILYASKSDAEIKRTEINMDSSQFYNAMILPCHNSDVN